MSDQADKEGIQKTSCVFQDISKNMQSSRAERFENSPSTRLQELQLVEDSQTNCFSSYFYSLQYSFSQKFETTKADKNEKKNHMVSP